MSGRLGMTGAAAARGDAAVAKSFIPGQGYVSASKMPRTQLRQLAHGGRRWMQHGQKLAEEQHSERAHLDAANHRAFMDQHKSFHSTKGKVQPRVLADLTMNREAGAHTAAFAMKTGGRRAPGAVYQRPGATRSTIEHEHAHIEPKRTGYRLQQQILTNPRKRMREEARADYLGGQHYRDAPHQGDSGYMDGARSERSRRNYAAQLPTPDQKAMFRRSATANYRAVQDRMSYAGTKQRVAPASTPRVIPMGGRPARQPRMTMRQRSARNARTYNPVERNFIHSPVSKVQTTMSDKEARQLARRYDTRGPLPGHLNREQRMKAYEARYIAAGGRKAEKWKHRADAAEVGRNVGLAGVTAAGALTLARKAPIVRRIPHHVLERVAVGAGTFGGASELYGEHARSRRASYQNSPAGVAGSALSRMQAYTPEKKR